MKIVGIILMKIGIETITMMVAIAIMTVMIKMSHPACFMHQV
jgi:hypothetical protein